jgi:hypothetical protein
VSGTGSAAELAWVTVAANAVTGGSGGSGGNPGGNGGTWGSAYGGGISHDASALIQLFDMILAGNAATNGSDLWGSFTTLGHNLIGNSAGGSGYGSSDLLDVDPLLGPLQDNGGPTWTMAVLPGSPAIDSGDNTNAPDWDQRGPGYPRIVNGTIDRGAFEVQNTAGPTGDPRSLATVPFSGAPTGRTTLARASGLGNPPRLHDEALKGRNSPTPPAAPLQGSKPALARVPRALPGADLFSPFGAPDDLANVVS